MTSIRAAAPLCHAPVVQLRPRPDHKAPEIALPAKFEGRQREE